MAALTNPCGIHRVSVSPSFGFPVKCSSVSRLKYSREERRVRRLKSSLLSLPRVADSPLIELIGNALKLLSSVELHGELTLDREVPGRNLSLQLMSNKMDSATGSGAICEGTVLNSTATCNDGVKYAVKFLVKKDFGVPGALIVNTSEPFTLHSLVLRLPDDTEVSFIDNGLISSQHRQNVFFAHKACLPLDTPSGLAKLRKQQLVCTRGNGEGTRVNGERIYDYDVYNDIGNPDVSPDLRRPILGGSKEFPYPRRCRTGRLPSNTDNRFERVVTSDEEVYLPAGEFPAFPKGQGPANDSMHSLYQLIPEIHKAYSSRPHFESFEELKDVFSRGFNLKPDSTDSDSIINFHLPQIIQANSEAWMLDNEFARQAIAGLNPLVIESLKVYPPRKSSLTEEHIQHHLEGITIDEALERRRLFVLDYTDAYISSLKKINAQEGVKGYASRTIYFLTEAGNLKPVAIELSLPSEESESESINRVFTPPVNSGERDWLWELAKAHASANDAAYHQAISHWLRTHAVLEPFVIATHRQLSDLHPVKALLLPHFKSTLAINSEARRLLVCAGGIIERAFFTGKYTLEISSLFYKSSWKFNEQDLPTDLLKRGMAVKDDSCKHGLKLSIEDYPYAVDGLEIWTAIQSWVSDYVDIFYKYDVSVCADAELQSWWKEIKQVGHADKKEGWQDLNGKDALKDILSTTIWLASAHHAAVNFGQYAYAGFAPNRPTITHRLIPEVGSPEHTELLEDPEKFFGSMLANRMETVTLLCAIELLSSHLPGEEFLGSIPSSASWTSNQVALEAFARFSQRLKKIEEDIEARNRDPRLWNRRGEARLPFTLLCPSSELGLTGRGVPNSVSI